MTAGFVTLARRWIGGLAVLASLIAGMPISVAAQESQTLVNVGKIGLFIRSGRNIDAIDLAKRNAEIAPPSERQLVYQATAWVCIVTLDVECARDVALAADSFLNALPKSEWNHRTIGFTTLLATFFEVATGDYQSSAQILEPRVLVKMANAVQDPGLFAELQLLAARRSRLVSDFEASRDHLDKALVSALSITKEHYDAPRLIVRIASQFLENYDIERAVRLVATAELLLEATPQDSFLYYEFLQLRAALFAYGKNYTAAVKNLRAALSTLERQQLRPTYKASLLAATYNLLLGLEVLRSDRDAAQDLLQSHPLMAAKPAILERGYFADGNEFNFALAEEFVRLALADPTETGWGDFLTAPPRWTKDPERIQEVEVFGQAAIGLRLIKAGRREEARRMLIGAARKRLSTLREQYRKSAYASPLPAWADVVLMEFALTATLGEATPDYDLIVQAHAFLNRSIDTSADDALTSQAVQTSDDKKRIAQGLRTIQYQQAGWEKAELAALTQRTLSPNEGNPGMVARDRQRILYSGYNFIVTQQQMRAALIDGVGAEGVDSIVSLATIRQSLLPDEALVLHASILGGLGKVCIRADQTISSTQEVGNAITDARLLMAALTAAHPASNEADSQFPAAEAARLGKLLFGGLEDCLRRSPRVYLLGSGHILTQVPPAVLLAEIPPRMGAGFDLRAARWMIRDHSFVRTSSLGAFVATKRLSTTKRATLDYLGIGDPVLATGNATAPSGGAFAARGSLPVQTGTLTSLPELPETSDELQQVADLFDKPKTHVLRREAASEEAFRLQPLSEFDIVHFATHGLIKEEQPGLREPSLVLTPNPDGDVFNDGLLTASQIASLPLRARLVVLSACNSARYEPSIIDSGIQGLATSFAMAGVPSMIASLWPLESSLTRDLIIGTFRAAREGNVAIADALAMAVRKHLDNPTTPRPLVHPRFWAALVVLGDGSLTLDASANNASRDLAPFSAVDPSERETIFFGGSLGKDLVTATVSRLNSERFASMLRRQTVDGTMKWEVTDREITAGPVVAGERMVYAMGYQALQGSSATAALPVLRAFEVNGKSAWTHRFSEFSERPAAVGLAVAQDQSAVAMIGPSIGQRTDADFSLIRIDASGREVARTHLSFPVYGQSSNSIHLSVDKAAGLAVVNRAAWMKAGADGQMVNGLGDAVQCWEGGAADIALVDMTALEERKRVRIDHFQVSDATLVGDDWIVVGSSTGTCGRGIRAAAYIIRSDGSVEEFWRDTSLFETSARGIRKIGSNIEIIGYAARLMGIPEQIPDPNQREVASIRQGDEAYVSGEIFSVRLSDHGVEQRRDFVGAGFPIVPMGMVATNDHSVIFGTVGSRPLWLAR